MSREEILNLEKESGLAAWWESGNDDKQEFNALLSCFFAIATAAEREACAKVCEAQIEEWVDDRPRYAASECATAIRSRGEE